MQVFYLCCCKDGVTVDVHNGSRETCPPWLKQIAPSSLQTSLGQLTQRLLKKTVNNVEWNDIVLQL
jgi:hypothetical protein